MTNRNAEKVRRRREKAKQDQIPSAAPHSKSLWFWILFAVLLSITAYLIYLSFINNTANEYIIPIIISVIALLVVIVWFLPKFYVRSLPHESEKGFDRKKERLKLEDDTRKTVAQIVGGAVILGSLLLTYNTFRLQQEGQITDRFTKAVAQLGDDKLEIRLGGLYALERIAKDSPKDHWTVMEIISAFIREKTIKKNESATEDVYKTDKVGNNKVSRKENNTKTSLEVKETLDEASRRTTSTDVQSAITIIGRRNVEQDSKTDKINLGGVDLRGANLSLLNLSGIDLKDADLKLTDLRRADLSEANLSGIRPRARSSLELLFNFLSEPYLKGADLSGANLSEANLRNTDFRGANLNFSYYLTFEQLSNAIIDESTKLPENLENRKTELLEISKKNLEKSVKESNQK